MSRLRNTEIRHRSVILVIIREVSLAEKLFDTNTSRRSRRLTLIVSKENSRCCGTERRMHNSSKQNNSHLAKGSSSGRIDAATQIAAERRFSMQNRTRTIERQAPIRKITTKPSCSRISVTGRICADSNSTITRTVAGTVTRRVTGGHRDPAGEDRPIQELRIDIRVRGDGALPDRTGSKAAALKIK